MLAMLVMNDTDVELEAATPEIPGDDEGVEVDAAVAVKSCSVSGDLTALRSNSRKSSTKTQGNNFERQKRPKESSSHRAFTDACNANNLSYCESEFNKLNLWVFFEKAHERRNLL